MTRVLVWKLLRDVRLPLLLVALLLGAFQCLWARITERILGQLSPFFNMLAALGGLRPADVEAAVFEGPGKIIRTLIGGEQIDLNGAMDLLSIGYVHPLMQTIFCIWAIGRAAGAVAGEVDRGTMELLLAQPIARSRLILAHFWVDVLTVPVLCLSLWAGTCLGTLLVGEIKVKPAPVKVPLRVSLQLPQENEEAQRQRLAVDRLAFAPALLAVAGLIFAVGGSTLWLSSASRFKWKVQGIAVLVALIQFLINLLGQMWELLGPLRPLTIFYYYQPQQMILGRPWTVNFSEWNGGQPLLEVPFLPVLYGVGAVGYAMAWWTLNRRDLPAPL